VSAFGGFEKTNLLPNLPNHGETTFLAPPLKAKKSVLHEDVDLKTSEQDRSSDGPLLSILMAGRDDDYMPDFRYRLTTTLDFIATNLARLGQLNRVEMLVVDWGSRVPLSETVEPSPEAASISRFLYVPPTLIRGLQDGRDDFNSSLSFNIALRRARGEFVSVSGADVLLTSPALDALLGLLGGKLTVPLDVRRTYFLCRRYHVPWQFVNRQPTLDQWDRHLLLHAGEYDKDRGAVFGNSSGAGALLMSREMWHEVRGLDERLGGWGHNDIELGLRINQTHPWIDLSYWGIAMFHMQHQPGEGKRATAIENWMANPRIHSIKSKANCENWGLPDTNLPLRTVQNVCDSQRDTSRCEAGPSTAADRCFESLTEMSRQLGSPEVRRDVEDAIRRIKSEFRDWRIEHTDLHALCLLAWYSRHHHPCRYLEFGIARGYATALVGNSCPSVEIYGIDRWEHECDYYSPTYVADLRQATTHCGYLRFVNGDPNTGLDRLQASFVGPCSFDLILLREECVDDAKAQLSRLLDHLAPNGALVLKGETTQSFESLWSDVRNARSSCTYFRPVGANTGLILKAQVSDDSDSREGDDLAPIVTKPLESLIDRLEQGTRISVALAKVKRALTRMRRYPEYANRVVRWIERTSQGEYSRQ